LIICKIAAAGRIKIVESKKKVNEGDVWRGI
jgi:hypothetical protein